MYDLIIIGGGPAGVSGAVYAARKRLKTLIIAGEIGGQSSVSDNIQNWIGTPSISGADFAKNLKSHLEAYRGEFLTIEENVYVASLEKKENTFFVATTDGKNFEGKTVLVVSGSSRRKLEAKGAEDFENKGLTYCATCDGPVFADQDVVVIGGGNAGFESAAQLLAYCKSVTILNRSNTFRADEITVNKVLAHPNMKAVKNLDILEVIGNKFVSGIVYKDLTTGEIITLPVTGIFIEIGQIPNTEFLTNILELDQFKKVVVDPMTQSTTQKGVWAAGDCTNGLYHQNNIASGDAVKALENIYLSIHAQ